MKELFNVGFLIKNIYLIKICLILHILQIRSQHFLQYIQMYNFFLQQIYTFLHIPT